MMGDVCSGVGVLFLLLESSSFLTTGHSVPASCISGMMSRTLMAVLCQVTRCLLLLEDSTNCKASSGTWSR